MERRLVFSALLVVPAVRMALWLLPYRTVHRAAGALARREPLRRAAPAEPILWAVTAVSARVPRATCLTQALAASLLLARHGHATSLRVGVVKDDDGRLRAHAWLESDGAAILGQPAPGAYHPFPPLVLR